MQDGNVRGVALLEAAVYVFIVLLFLTLGTDPPDLIKVRIGFGVFVLAGFVLLWRRERVKSLLKNSTVFFFLGFLGFEILRSGWAVWLANVKGIEESVILPLHRYIFSPLPWLFQFGFFTGAFTLFRNTGRANRLLWVLSWTGFFLAMNAIPALLISGRAGYAASTGGAGFFYPLFYFHEIIPRYVMGRYFHPNFTGDVIALGCFPALGLVFYSLELLRGKKRAVSPAQLILPATSLGVTASAVILFFSRAAIVSFAAAILFFLAAILLKFPSRIHAILVAVLFFSLTGFLLWAGNLQGAWKEVQTLEREKEFQKGEGSFAANVEGAKRALRIHRSHPLGGIGTGGYESVSLLSATPGTEEKMKLVQFRAMNHYLHKLAEEGMGAFLYFAFLVSYLIEAAKGFFRTRSRFQFITALSLFAAVLMVLTHAAVNHLMEFFSVSTLVYLLMGASLGVLRKDFEHHP